MKKYISLLFLLLSIGTYAQDQTIPSFLEKWEHSKNYLIEVARAMPVEKYDYKPTEREMSFKEQLQHIQQNMEWLGNSYFKKKEGTIVIDRDVKEQTITNLTEAFDLVSEAVKALPPKELNTTVDFFDGEKTKLQMLNLLQDHVTHHRGQLIVYLNLNNVEPPKYIGW